jgi:hypothetical protein
MWIRDGWNWVRIVSSGTLNNGGAVFGYHIVLINLMIYQDLGT